MAMSIPMEKTIRIFVGSSKEHLDYAKAVQINLHKDYEMTVWDQRPHVPSQHILDSLLEELDRVQFGIFVLAPDDFLTIRGERKKAPRDNVIFELGLFIGRLGRDFVFMLSPFDEKCLRLPTDLEGIPQLEYESKRIDENLVAALAPACFHISKSISAWGKTQPNNIKKTRRMISWGEFVGYLNTLCQQINQSPRNGGYICDAVVGIASSGIIAADLIARKCCSNVPVLCISPDRYTAQPLANFNTDLNMRIINVIKDEGYRRVLVVDDMVNSGHTMKSAVRILKEKLGSEVELRSATVICDPKAIRKLNYFGVQLNTSELMTPFAASLDLECA